MRFSSLIILLLISLSDLCAQTVTILSDGIYSCYINLDDDTAYLEGFSGGTDSRKYGLKKGDKIIYINGNKVSGAGITNQDFQDFIQASRGTVMKFSILRENSDSLLTYFITLDSDQEPWFNCFYDYLVDTTKKLSANHFFSDPARFNFYSPNKNGTTVYSLSSDSTKPVPDILPGDEFISFRKGSDSWAKLFFREYGDQDTIIKILRDSSLFYLHDDLRKYPEFKINTVLSHDLESEAVWLRIILKKRLIEDKSYLIRFSGSYDTILLYQRSPDGQLAEKMSGEKYARNTKDSYYKDKPVIRLNLRQEGIDTLFIRIERAGGIIYPPVIDFLTMDYVNNFEKTERLILGSLLGMMLIISFYYLIIYMFLKDKSYLIFLLYILSLVFTLFYLSGYGSQFIWPRAIEFFEKISALFSVLPMTFFAMFSSVYLILPSTLPRFHKSGKIILIISWVFSFLLLINALRNEPVADTDFRSFCESAVMLAMIILGLMIIIAVAIRMKQHYKPASGLLVGVIISVLSITIYTLADDIGYFLSTRLNLSPDISAMFLMASIYIGAILQFLILSLALGKKMRDDNLEMKSTQQRVIEQLKENELLREKVNRELEQKVRDRTYEIELQKNKLQEQKQEITDSINYAKRIQTAVLPSKEIMDQLLPEHFVLFKPRDIVSGDFFWVRKIYNYIIIVVADCTGHGVPGAFMSMLGLSLMNEQVSRSKFDRAGEILNRLRKKIKETLNQEGRFFEQKDGMDLALAIIDNDSLEMQFSGAFNPIYIVRKKDVNLPVYRDNFLVLESDDHYLIEIRGDRQPVSIHYSEKDFTTHEFKLEREDTIYLFSDGYMDQIGGETMKKFMYKNFKNLLLNIQGNSLSVQKEILETRLSEWQGIHPQIDDITVVGVKW